MILRHRLVILQSAFAVFAVIVSVATIHGVNLHVQSATESLERLAGRVNNVERLRVDARAQLLELYEVATGRRKITPTVRARRFAFFTRLEEVDAFAEQSNYRPIHDSLSYVVETLEERGSDCLRLVEESKQDEALALLREEIEPNLHDALDTHLASIQSQQQRFERARVDEVIATSNRLLGLTSIIGAACAAFVVAGAYLVRRWLLVPISKLHRGTEEFAQGNLNYRITCAGDDEMEQLGLALNEMASSLFISQTKYRSLFENLRDAVIICDTAGRVVECRDSDTQLLSVKAGDLEGDKFSDVRTRWEVAHWDWDRVLVRVTGARDRIDAVDVEWPAKNGRTVMVDIIAYPVEYGGERYAAVVLRDVSERFRLQHLERRAETMEAAETFARGLTHDFKNLLNSAVMSLSLVQPDSENGKSADRIQTALESCRQASRLSKRLLEFSCLDQGNPEIIEVAELITIVLESVKESFLASIKLESRLDPHFRVRMDRDHLTQVLLNLIRNAQEAMDDGESLRISTEHVVCVDPINHGAPKPFVVVTVADTGCGMPANVRQRLFEPLYSTKPRDNEGVRGLGLALVYAAVRQVGGFIQVDSEVGVGTTFRVHIPAAESAPESEPEPEPERPATSPPDEPAPPSDPAEASNSSV